MCMGSKYILIIRNILSYNYPLYSSHQFYTLFPVSTIHIKLKYSILFLLKENRFCMGRISKLPIEQYKNQQKEDNISHIIKL